MKTKLILFAIIFFTFSVLLLCAQEENGDTIYVIRELEYHIEGRTRPFALMSQGEFTEGELIKGKENFEKYLTLKTQLLINQRVLEDARIEYSLGSPEEDGALPVKLQVYVKDTWNIIVLPYPKYDSNDGLSITLKGRDYNFLGTMSALRVDLGYRQDGDEKIINFSIDTNLPFQAFGLDWSFNFENYFQYTFGEPLYYQNVTGLSLNLPWQLTTFTVGFNQYLTFNEKITDENKENYNLSGDFYDPYGSTEIFGSWKIPFGLEVGSFGDLGYTTRLSGMINYPYGKMDEPRKPVTSLSHSIGFGRTHWIGNYRKGLSASIGNAFNWYFDRSDAPIQITIDGGATLYWPFSKYIGINSRFKFRQWWHYSNEKDEWLPYYSAGDVLRGVLDEDIRAKYMFSLNLDIPIRLLRFWPSEWFNNPKLHFFDFEMHFSPFTDVAMLQGPYSELKENYREGTQFRLGDMINTGGFEIIVFPAFFRSFYIRGSVGYNLKKIKNEGFPSLKWGFFPQWDEIYIGVDHYY